MYQSFAKTSDSILLCALVRYLPEGHAKAPSPSCSNMDFDCQINKQAIFIKITMIQEKTKQEKVQVIIPHDG